MQIYFFVSLLKINKYINKYIMGNIILYTNESISVREKRRIVIEICKALKKPNNILIIPHQISKIDFASDFNPHEYFDNLKGVFLEKSRIKTDDGLVDLKNGDKIVVDGSYKITFSHYDDDNLRIVSYDGFYYHDFTRFQNKQEIEDGLKNK